MASARSTAEKVRAASRRRRTRLIGGFRRGGKGGARKRRVGNTGTSAVRVTARRATRNENVTSRRRPILEGAEDRPVTPATVTRGGGTARREFPPRRAAHRTLVPPGWRAG